MFETQLGKRLVHRDRKHVGLTPEGEAILPWAQQFVAAAEAMGQVSCTARGPLKGELRLGAIPASMPATGYLVEAVRARFPELNVKLRALTSRLIERELSGFELDAGVTYLDFEPPAHTLAVPLYGERSMLVSSRGGIALPERPDWSDLGRLPFASYRTACRIGAFSMRGWPRSGWRCGRSSPRIPASRFWQSFGKGSSARICDKSRDASRWSRHLRASPWRRSAQSKRGGWPAIGRPPRRVSHEHGAPDGHSNPEPRQLL